VQIIEEASIHAGKCGARVGCDWLLSHQKRFPLLMWKFLIKANRASHGCWLPLKSLPTWVSKQTGVARSKTNKIWAPRGEAYFFANDESPHKKKV